MTDIVDRLRLLQSEAACECDETASILKKAADEIEQLREALQDISDVYCSVWEGSLPSKDGLEEIDNIAGSALAGDLYSYD